MRNIGIQLYTLRETIKKDGLLPVLKEVAKIGYHGIEGGAFMGNMGAKEMRAVLDDLGLKYVSGHISTADINVGYEKILDDYAVLGAKYVGLAWIGAEHRQSAADWRRNAGLMEDAARAAQKHGLTFFYHNHDFEFAKFDGQYGFDILWEAADPQLVKSELDVYWVQKGGEDPINYMRKLGSRAPLIHAKDMTNDGKKFFEIVGEGCLDFATIFTTGDVIGVDWYLVEQDQCPKGEMASARQSFENIKARGWIG